MELIKTYKHVHHTAEDINFRIARMAAIWEERLGAPDVPHRHDYYTVLLVKQANAKHVIDFNDYEMNHHQVFFVSPGQVHQIIEYEKSHGYVFMFSTDFLARNNIPVSFIDDLNLFNEYGHTPPLPISNEELEKLTIFCDQMIGLYESPQKFTDQALGSLLQLFLINCNNLCTVSIDNTQNREAGNVILRNFKELVNENYTTWHAASEYAENLHVTPDHVNRVVKSLTGKTAKDYIQARIIVAAKRMLYFSDESLKEITFQLGFSEPANFSAFFKKCTGVSPSQFVKKT